jgi:hypothetical protein
VIVRRKVAAPEPVGGDNAAAEDLGTAEKQTNRNGAKNAGIESQNWLRATRRGKPVYLGDRR